VILSNVNDGALSVLVMEQTAVSPTSSVMLLLKQLLRRS